MYYTHRHLEETQRLLREVSEGGFTRNVATEKPEKAKEYAEKQAEGGGKSLDKLIPEFDKNYKELQKVTKAAKNVPRVEMPVIEPEDMKMFSDRLKQGKLDIFKPFAKGKLIVTPNKWDRYPKEQGDEWVVLGTKDGQHEDDVIKAKWTSTAVKDLKPTQNQIWLEKLIKNIVKWGPPKAGSPVLSTTIIVSQDGYILDGHHRFGQVMLVNPSLKIKSLNIPLDIKKLLKISRTYAASIGREPKA